jgi:hypothetical protein
VVGRIRLIEKSSDLIRNLTHDLLTCSIVPQPTMLLHDPIEVAYVCVCIYVYIYLMGIKFTSLRQFVCLLYLQTCIATYVYIYIYIYIYIHTHTHK